MQARKISIKANLDLLWTIRKHQNIARKRSLSYEQNKIFKYIVWGGEALGLSYMVLIAVSLGFVAKDNKELTASELMFGIAPFILTADFLLRFLMQQTPSQLIKPYILLPISKYTCIDCFIASQMLSLGNLVWFSILIPYALMAIIFSEGVMVALGLFLAFYLLILINSLWYMTIRTLINNHVWWLVLPVFIYTLIFSPWFIGKESGITTLIKVYSTAGYSLATWHPLSYVILICILFCFIVLNRRLQYINTWRELSRQEQTKLRHISEFKFLNRFGEIGEYMKLEIKSILRNKNLRKTFILVNVVAFVFSMLLSFTDIYDGRAFTNFWCTYIFIIYGTCFLSKTMCYEGNYIDGLMVHKENIKSLLFAKYYIYSAMLIFPLILIIPTVIVGKNSILMLLSVMFFTFGPVYSLLLTIGIFNKQTIPLNEKFIGKTGIENNYMQIILQLAAFSIPIIILTLLQIVFNNNTAYLIFMLIGLVFVFTHRLWINSIYKSMMKRRYENLAGFRASK